MVAKRGLGSGLINNHKKIDNILNKIYSESDISISIKMRLGYEKSKEIFNLLPILEKYPIKNIAIHPRLGTQLYNGEVDLDSFQKCIYATDHKIYYNGDITSINGFNELTQRFSMIDHWMIGRGIISYPYLPTMIKSNTSTPPKNWINQFKKFHDTLFHEYEQSLSGSGHLIKKMYQFWEYFIKSFPNSSKGLKQIKKAKSISIYENAVREIFDNAL